MVRVAGIVMGLCWRGLEPGRARPRRTEKVPKPGTQKRLSLRIARAMWSKVSSMARATVFFSRRVARATVSISSALVMGSRLLPCTVIARAHAAAKAIRYPGGAPGRSGWLWRRLRVKLAPNQTPTHALVAYRDAVHTGLGHHALEDRSAGDDHVGACGVETLELAPLLQRHRAEQAQHAFDVRAQEPVAVHAIRVVGFHF